MDKDKLHRSLAHIAAGADKMAQAANIIAHGMKNDDSPARIAKHLADYGLLAPDLPEANDAGIIVPGGKGWLPQGLTGPSVWTAPGGRVMVQRVEPGDLIPKEARDFAYTVLAAANYAGGNDG
ncbi:hypothetical protein [Corynebacterium guaraldiae]|uniref:hypothetical protein n=1 Tax=Corynebacterium guaraldiae TaxID=3051103 RepID=UPI0011787EF2|nr:hypothetical protein [Corynebacterium guaraldiae]MCG7261191.1 hypothetical protein [Corynebacterium aurimucosum]TRX42507.1 hypothetical protein FNY89_03165 [Corynebacterium guaraldiae]